ncbi:MAG: T9SS type A sorting domain-containing protein [Candidatus Neomarinimicrobiota bacterium]
MKEIRTLIRTGLLIISSALMSLIYAGNIAREFNIFAPPQSAYVDRASFVVVTAVVGNNRVTEVDIIDRDEDGDSDDTHENLTLTQGQSYVLYIKDGSINDDYAVKRDGDYFRINGSHRIQTMIGTASDWEYDYVPPYWHTNGTVDFFVYVPYGQSADEWRLNVICYENNTSVLVEDITNTVTQGSGYTSVKAIGTGTVKWNGILNEGQDLLKVKGVNALSSYPGGRTFHVHANDSVAVMVGSLKQNDSGRDDGCYVMDGSGLNVAKEFYFYQPDGDNSEKEVKINTYSQPATINLYCWNNNQWNPIVTNQALEAYDYFTYTGNDGIGYTQELFKLTATNNVAVCTGTWLETGDIGTSDMACYVSSEYGYGAGHNYIVYLAPPGTEPDGDYTHAYITTIDSNTTVTIKDIATNGTIINESIALSTNEFYDLKVNTTTWNQLTSGDNEPYIRIYSTKELRVFNSNWNDNWLAFAAGIVVPQYSPLYYENFPYERWVFMGLPLQTTSNNPDSIFGPYFGGPEWKDDSYDNRENTNWRFSRWDIDYNTYVRWGERDYDGGRHGDPARPQPGFGYWFYNRYGSAIDFPVYGTAVDLDESYYIPINPPQGESHPGLNQLANPFPIVIDWKDAGVEVTTNSGTSEKTLSAAVADGLISQWSHRWNGYEYIPYNATNGGDFMIWDGFWVEQLKDSTDATPSTATYSVAVGSGGHNYDIVLFNPNPALADNQVDRIRIDFASQYYPQLIEVTSYIYHINYPSSTKYIYPCYAGGSVVTSQGFAVTLVEVGSDHYILEVRNSGNTVPLFGFKFTCYLNSLSSPVTGTTYTATRLGGTSGSGSPISLRLKVPPTDVDLAKSHPVADNRNPFRNLITEAQEWFLALSVRSNADGNVRDTYNGFGQKVGAFTQFDQNDARNITPYLDSFIDIYFPHNDKSDLENYWVSHPIKTCYDLRPERDTTNWDFVVSSYNYPGQNSTLFWGPNDLPEVLQLTLIDLQNQNTVDMKSDSTYIITTPTGNGLQTLNFRIQAIRPDLVVTGLKEPGTQPLQFALDHNYPNPFNATTMIRYTIDQAGQVKLAVYAIDGTLVKTIVNDHMNSGEYKAIWDGRDQFGRTVASGIYFYRLTIEQHVSTRKMVLLK